MIDNPRSPRVRAVAKLAKRSARRDAGLFLVEGPQAVGEAFAFAAEFLVDVYADPSALDRHGDLIRAARSASVAVHPVSPAVLDAMADTVTPQGIVAVLRHLPASIELLVAGAPRLIAVLEEVRDPGNAGTIIRAADAAGADGVVLTGHSVDLFNPKVVRSTTGSLFHLPLAQGLGLPETLARLRESGLRILAADVSGRDLLDLRSSGELAGPTAWLFGNEARGLTVDLLALADDVVRVPVYGHAESMNLATAASVCLYESAFAQRIG